MDGATNFIKGDAIAGLIITVVNIVGGLIMGVTRHAMAIGEAASTYTILSIGDGLVNQLPSLLVAAASAFMITKGSSKSGTNAEMLIQFLRYKEPLKILSGTFGILGIASLIGLANGIPWIVCFTISGVCYYLTTLDVSKVEKEEEEEVLEKNIVEEVVENTLHVEKILVHIGTNVASAIVQGEGNNIHIANELKYRIEVLKDKIKSRYGIKIPNVRITDDIYIPSNSFLVRISNMTTASLEIKPNCVFAAFFGETKIDFGEPAEIRHLGLKGYWVTKEKVSDVESMGAVTHTIFDIITLHLEYTIESHLDKIISREDIKQYKEEVQSYNGAIIEEINQRQIPNSTIQKVVQGLLAEKVPIKNFEYILECIGDYYAERNGQIIYWDLMNYIRKKLGNVITERFVQNGSLSLVRLTMESEECIKKKISGEIDEKIQITFTNICSEIASTYMQMKDMGQEFVFICDKTIRQIMFETLWDLNLKIDIISHEELPRMVQLVTIKSI